jgi:RNA polymerase sigma-70 factor (ECF subfamily)
MPDSATRPDLDRLRRRIAASDEEAFEAVFERFGTQIFRFVRGMVGDDALAHDLVQDTFTKLWTAREKLSDVDSLPAYLYQIARNAVYSHQRSEQTRRDYQESYGRHRDGTWQRSPDDDLQSRELQSKMQEWVEALPDRQREALLLAREDDLSHDEIAEVMDISANTVNNHIVKAMKTLRHHLREYRPDLTEQP